MDKPLELRGSQSIDWMYPEIYGHEKPHDSLNIALYHTRAANNIQIKYDSDRDGWVIFMERTTQNEDGFVESTGRIEEVAFVPAWLED